MITYLHNNIYFICRRNTKFLFDIFFALFLLFLFALLHNRKYMYFTTFVITREDVNEYMSHHPEYTKANRFKDIICKIYI